MITEKYVMMSILFGYLPTYTHPHCQFDFFTSTNSMYNIDWDKPRRVGSINSFQSFFKTQNSTRLSTGHESIEIDDRVIGYDYIVIGTTQDTTHNGSWIMSSDTQTSTLLGHHFSLIICQCVSQDSPRPWRCVEGLESSHTLCGPGGDISWL